jgi:hypothetical protein
MILKGFVSISNFFLFSKILGCFRPVPATFRLATPDGILLLRSNNSSNNNSGNIRRTKILELAALLASLTSSGTSTETFWRARFAIIDIEIQR